MALTMTRTRTQTALTRLVTLLANLNGELEFVERLTRELPEFCGVLEARRLKLAADRAAVYATIRQFDPELCITAISTVDHWKRPYRARTAKTLARRYLKLLVSPT